MLKEKNFICDSCSTEFTILTNSNEPVEVCPFCGEYLEAEDDDLDDLDFDEE